MSCEQEAFPDKSKKLYKKFNDKMKLYKVIDFYGDSLYVAEFDGIEVDDCPATNENLIAISEWCIFHMNDVGQPFEFGAEEKYDIEEDPYIEDLPEDLQTIMRMNKEEENEEEKQSEREDWLQR